MPTIAHYSNELAGKLPVAIEKGRQEASAHRPATAATHLDQHEAAYRAESESWVANEHQLFATVLTEGSRAAAELRHKALELEGRIEQVLSDNSIASSIAANMADDRQDLIQVTEARMRAQVDWQYFRAHHGIMEEAEYPDSRVFHFALVAALALIETFINAVFFSNAQGLLGGFFVALAVSVVNLGGALVLGMLFRFKNLSDRQSQLGGWASLVAFAILSIYCNALFSSFRAEYQLLEDPNNAGALRDAFTRATEEAGKVFLFNAHFADLMSFILFGTGLLLSCLAFYKGMTVDDRYPGHGKKDRGVKAALRLEQDRQNVLREKVKGLLNARRRELQTIIQEPVQLTVSAGSRIAEIEQRYAACTAAQDAVQRDFALLLQSYRGANAAIRATEPPAYFAHVPDVRKPLNDELVASILTNLRAIQETAKSLRDRYQDSLNEKLNAFHHDAATILNEAFAVFMRGVEREAEDLINRQITNIPAVA